MIKKDVKIFMQKLKFSIEDQNELVSVLDTLLSNQEFLDILNRYESDNFDFNKMIEDTKILAQNINICCYSAHLVLFICMVPTLYKRYIQKGINAKIFYDTMCDLRYKLEECKLVHGKVGTFVPNWYKGIFEMRIFALGRLQFEINHTWFDCEVNGLKLPKDTKVLSVHIPRTGTPLSHDLVIDSYNQAKEFFKDQFENDIIFICNSWLLYPWNRKILKDTSNLAQFYDDFTVVISSEYKNYSEVWRLFDCLYDENPDNLPADTSLRRAYIERIKSSLPIGYGIGVII